MENFKSLSGQNMCNLSYVGPDTRPQLTVANISECARACNDNYVPPNCSDVVDPAAVTCAAFSYLPNENGCRLSSECDWRTKSESMEAFIFKKYSLFLKIGIRDKNGRGLE